MMTCRRGLTAFDGDSNLFLRNIFHDLMFVIGCLGVNSGRFGCVIRYTKGRSIQS